MRADLMQAVLAIGALLVMLSFWRSHCDRRNNFDLFDLLMDDGRLSKVSVGYMAVLGVSTWVVVNQEIHGRLTEGTFGLYMTAWVAPLVAKMATNAAKKTEEPKA